MMLDDLKKILNSDTLDNLREQVGNLKDRLKLVSATGDSGAGMVKVTIDGNYNCTKVSIADEVMQENKDVLESLIQNAIDKANIQLQSLIKQATLSGMHDNLFNQSGDTK